ncbi:MAG: SpoIIIAH-like family protein [Oscillospiraceae bacterium]|jgi:stage III sporulation protein AH|nr:SpoIIIAH-like family protein [Oscillospiraceae bacterium]
MKIWKRNAVIMTVILFVCVALYLSWSDNRSEDGLSDEMGSFLDGADGLLQVHDVQPEAGDPLAGVDVGVIEPGTDTIVQSASPGGEADSYFAQARLSRQRARDSTLEILNRTAGQEGGDQSLRDKAAALLESLARDTLKEAQIEELVKAKGFADCVAFLSESGVNIVVAPPKGGLLASDVAKIQDIVVGETTLPATAIKIVPAKV